MTGVSAGAVMANIMAKTYPDIYAATSILAGCEYGCDVLQSSTPEQSGQWAINEMGSRRRAVPAIVFQGTADVVVPPSTADRIVGKWATVDGIDTIPDATGSGQVPGVRSFTRSACACSLYGDPSGPDATGVTWTFFAAHPMR